MSEQVTVIISPVDDCNLACRYCVDPRTRTGVQMSLATLESCITKVAEYSKSHGKPTRFIWHGGEPLLAGRDFYQNVVELSTWLKRKGYVISHSMQTNATLLTPENADFFVNHKFAISFSLDGPRHLNDLTRCYPNGESTFSDAIKGIQAYKDLTGSANVICVLTSANISMVEEIFEFFKEHGIAIQFNPWYEVPGAATNLRLNPKQYAAAIIKLYDVWFNEINPDYVGLDITSHELFCMCLCREPISCWFRENCQLGEIYGIDPSGNVLPCSRFYGTQKFIFGNIDTIHSFDEIASSPRRVELQQRHIRVQGCDECSYHSICNSGCMQHAYAQYGSVDYKDPLCSAYHEIFSHVSYSIQSAFDRAKT